MSLYEDCWEPHALHKITGTNNVILHESHNEFIEYVFRWEAEVYDTPNGVRLWHIEFDDIIRYAYTEKAGYTKDLTDSDGDYFTWDNLRDITDFKNKEKQIIESLEDR